MSTSGGATWTKIDSVLDDGWAVVLTPKEIYEAGSWYNTTRQRRVMAVRRSTDHGVSWIRSLEGTEQGEVRAIAVSPASSDIILAGGWSFDNAGQSFESFGCMFRSSDAGVTWQEVGSEIFRPDSGAVTTIAFDPADPMRVLVGSTSGIPGHFWPLEGTNHRPGVYTSLDAGLTWSLGAQRIDATCIVADSGSPGRFFLGSSQGVWMSTDHGISWQQINNGLPVLLVDCMTYDAVKRYLYVGTYGMGVFRLDVGSALAVERDPASAVPTTFAMEQNYPNPFNPKTIVSSQLPVASDVRIAIYDVLGREVKVLVDEGRAAGYFEDTFDGSGLASGIYICRLTAGPYVESRKMMLLK